MNLNFRLMTLLVFALLLLGATSGWGFGPGEVRNASPEVKACMEARLGAETMDDIRNGSRPEGKAARMAVRAAYEECAESAGLSDVPVYDGPLFDAMAQIDETVDMDKAMTLVRGAGVSRIALFARSRKRLHQNEKAVLELAKRNPDLVVLGAPKYFQLSGDVSSDYIRATADGIRKHGYRFVGELLYTHGDKQSGKLNAAGERYVDPSRPGTARLLKALAPLKVPFMAHWEPYAPERDFPRFHALYAAWPDQVFLLPHMGFASADQLASFLEQHPNLYALTSKKERYMGDFADSAKQAAIGEAMLDGKRLRPEWKALLIRFQDRILFATDPHMRKLWRRYAEGVEGQRLILGQLPRAVAEKIAYRNAEKVYGVSVGK
ncbi:amidohydrolase family protein [Pseudodesulfovibrio cashew]|uniref:Amidohydrolase family protein n=1 Tax=Pseudodesulfovibrio cashew TaxID=2678688 RepID=A0A6I6JCG0_9BACT|nr:amidohydrolase family protein [Pseudodesulfovibrio cashew]QGY38778.1 amidohydrolase family protein [Pseudodesulfovibrio cashew]